VYHEEYTPCFLWTLALAPCFIPFVWCVRNLGGEIR
jgi:hypothetical protein